MQNMMRTSTRSAAVVTKAQKWVNSFQKHESPTIHYQAQAAFPCQQKTKNDKIANKSFFGNKTVQAEKDLCFGLI